MRAIRAHWPSTRILIRADSHYCGPLVIDWCRANGIDFILGLAPTATLRKRVETLEASTMARFEASAKKIKVRRFKEFFDGAASWSRTERIIARVEVGPQGADTRFIVTSLAGGRAKALYEDVYCRRGAAENHIKSWKTHLAADRTSCTRAVANQFRLFLHAGAYWLMWGLRAAMPKRSSFAVAQFDTLRLRFIKIAARGRKEDPDPRLDAHRLPPPGHPTRRPRAYPAPRHLTDGAAAAPRRTPRPQPANPAILTRRTEAGGGNAMSKSRSEPSALDPASPP